jgi:hypothetical protein
MVTHGLALERFLLRTLTATRLTKTEKMDPWLSAPWLPMVWPSKK